MAELLTAHTSALDAAALTSVRALLADVFVGDFEEHDWEHALGGIHAIVWEEGRPIGHASVVQRRLLHRGCALRAGYVEGVAVRADRRGRGHGAALMAAIEEVIRGAYELGALGASEQGAALYLTRGWQRWRGPLSALTPAGVMPTPEDRGDVFVLAGAVPLDLAAELTCDWRDGALW